VPCGSCPFLLTVLSGHERRRNRPCVVSNGSPCRGGGSRGIFSPTHAPVDWLKQGRLNRVDRGCLQVIRQQATIAALTADVRAWEDASSRHAALHIDATNKLQSELDEKTGEVYALRKELSARPSVADVASLRQQLSAYEALYFNVEECDNEQSSGSQGIAASSVSFGARLLGLFTPSLLTTEIGTESDGGIHSSVHSIVMKRVRQLESAVTKLSRENQELATSIEVRTPAVPVRFVGITDAKRTTLLLNFELPGEESRGIAFAGTPERPAHIAGELRAPVGNPNCGRCSRQVADAKSNLGVQSRRPVVGVTR
jgi:hypothetical protein